MAELLALAWACDLTRVASLQFSGAVARTIYSDLGQNEVNHVLSHDAKGQDQVHDSVVFVVKQLTRWLQKLQSTADGATHLLDRSCILFTSDTAEGFSHAYEDHPILSPGAQAARSGRLASTSARTGATPATSCSPACAL